MLHVSQKRTYDAFLSKNSPFSHEFGYSPHAAMNIESYSTSVEACNGDSLSPLPLKKVKVLSPVKDKSEQPKISTQSTLDPVNTRINPKYPLNNKSTDIKKWLLYLPRHRRRHHLIIGSFQASNKNESLFSLDDLKNIVNGERQELEEELRKEFEITLCNRLVEQITENSRFNEDCINRQLQESPFSYVS